jgi:hypothetical protein
MREEAERELQRRRGGGDGGGCEGGCGGSCEGGGVCGGGWEAAVEVEAAGCGGVESESLAGPMLYASTGTRASVARRE